MEHWWTLLKNGNASTLDIVNQVKRLMPDIQASAPADLRIELLFDQSLFVTAAIGSVVTESVIAGLLAAAMILMFLGSWRSTLIVAVSIRWRSYRRSSCSSCWDIR